MMEHLKMVSVETPFHPILDGKFDEAVKVLFEMSPILNNCSWKGVVKGAEMMRNIFGAQGHRYSTLSSRLKEKFEQGIKFRGSRPIDFNVFGEELGLLVPFYGSNWEEICLPNNYEERMEDLRAGVSNIHFVYFGRDDEFSWNGSSGLYEQSEAQRVSARGWLGRKLRAGSPFDNEFRKLKKAASRVDGFTGDILRAYEIADRVSQNFLGAR